MRDDIVLMMDDCEGSVSNFGCTGIRIMPSRKSFVLAGFAIVIASAAASDALAGRQVHGGDVARLLNGRAFRIECVDGTVGRGQISTAGVANVLYRRPSTRGPEEADHAVVRVKGVEICLAWRQFGGGGDGCYPVSEEQPGIRYRLSTGPLWCDISPK
jgi:hypothetical protein